MNFLLNLKSIFFALLFISGEGAFSQQERNPPGVIEGLKTIVEDSREKLQKEYQNLETTNKTITSPSEDLVKNLKIADIFLRSIFLHSEKKYLEMINLNQCHLYALLENKLLKSGLGVVDNLIVENGDEKSLIKYSDYIEQIYKFKCQNFAQISKIFNKTNLKKTILSLTYQVPKTSQDCKTILDDWKKNDYLPYLCKIPQSIQLGDIAEANKVKADKSNIRNIQYLNGVISTGTYFKEEIPFFQRSYLKNICNGIDEEKNFCAPYLANDAWTRILNGELSSDYIKYKCLNLFKKNDSEILTQVQMNTCVKRMKESPTICIDKSADGFTSIFPRPNCSLISKALNQSRIKVPYHDCPGQVDNGAVTNIHRILSHYLDRDISSNSETCQAEANLSLLNLTTVSKNTRGWPLKICYNDKIEGKEICLDYIPGSLDKTAISEEKVVTKILRRMTSISTSQSCKVATKSQFNPALLEYKNGCHIVFDEKSCSNAYCPKEIFVDEKKVEGLKFMGSTSFEYVPNNWRDQKKSGIVMLEEGYSLASKKLRNLTELEVYLRQNEKAIIHGIGCAEDILPHFFQRKTFGKCTPLPFILDGVLKEDDNKLLITRTSVDDIHSPRLIPWNWIFTAVMKYKEKHPLNQWNLYGIK
ncbi:MAG: hypothetical protein K9K67_01525 [Bacteriovoracaceae bacterium]|nr:hypothetical protein [Bacteriovoracaceae bacterium]